MYFRNHFALFLLASETVLLGHAAPTKKHPACDVKIKFIGARGTYAPPGPGGLSKLHTMLAHVTNSTAIKAVNYPATAGNPPYMDSVKLGAHDAQAQIMKAVDRCPDVQIVLTGYSQGAHVVLDAVCGSVDGGKDTPPLPEKYQSNIKAIVAMGDPTHYEPQSFVEGTVKVSGRIPRKVQYDCSPYTDKIISFCDAGDPYCASGDNQTVHNGYIQRYLQPAYNFTLSKLTI